MAYAIVGESIYEIKNTNSMIHELKSGIHWKATKPSKPTKRHIPKFLP